MRITPKQINIALEEKGFPIRMYRSPKGYYYFSVASDDAPNWVDDVPSIYEFNLSGFTVSDIIDHVQHAIDTYHALLEIN